VSHALENTDYLTGIALNKLLVEVRKAKKLL